MCSVYELGTQRDKLPAFITADGAKVLDMVDEPRLIRRTDSAPVVFMDGNVEMMRWGFVRPRLGVICNSREDKLSRPMWHDSFQHRRCLIPLLAFYEWSGPKGSKQTHRFTQSDGRTLWAAGIWEDVENLGRCFSMITTAANAFMTPIHDRMPALLDYEQLQPYLDGNISTFHPDERLLDVQSDAPNPLKKPSPPDPQGSLF